MNLTIKHHNQTYIVDLSTYTDISISMGGENAVQAWYLDLPTISPVKADGFIGSVAHGAPVNFRNVAFNPHAHITHTECMGHIDKTIHSVNQHLNSPYHMARVISVLPEQQGEDKVVTLEQIQQAVGVNAPAAVVIRTLPNKPEKCTTNYSHTNPTYLHHDAALWLRQQGVEHLLIDTPSVDREEDNGELKAHKAFWNYPSHERLHCTITEFVFIPDSLADGLYFLNLQTAPFENDATPSRPVLHHITKQ